MAVQQIDTIVPVIKQLVWLNKNNQRTVVANSRRASNGALMVQQSVIVAGLSVIVGTLDGWMARSDYEALVAHNATTLTPFVITINDDVMNVIWDNTGDAITGDDLFTRVGGDATLTNVTLRFLTV